jgi:hypothetical protein
MGNPFSGRGRVCGLVLVFLVCSPPAWSDGLTEQVIQRFRAADPQLEIKEKGPNDLQLRRAGEEMQVYLDNVRRICGQTPEACSEQSDLLVQVSLRMLTTEGGRAADAARLRVVIRGRDYVDGLNQTLSTGPGVPRNLVVRPLSDALVAMLVVDMPEAVSPLMDDELEKMNLGEANAWERAMANSHQALAGIRLNPLDTHVFGLGGDFFAPAWLLSSHWEAFARDHRVSVAWACVYDADEAVFVFDNAAQQEKVQRACSWFLQRARKPVSDRLMVWKKDQPQWTSPGR